MDIAGLVKSALEIRESAYAPYSGFRVGAALLADDGSIYTGVNVENATYGATCCAERTAAVKAVSEGGKRFTAIAIASDSEDCVYPCGICRQVLAEFADDDMTVICCRKDGSYRLHKLGDLLPNAFRRVNGKFAT